MSALEFVLRSRRVLTAGSLAPASVRVRDARIVEVRPYDALPEGVPVDDRGDLVVMPGLIDTHVHINEPGRTEWEGFATATRAAAAGGVTTLVDMPLNSIPATIARAALEAKVRAADGQCHVDVAFCGGVVPGNAGELRALRDAGVVAFKCFMIESGVPEFGNVNEDDLRAAMSQLAQLGVPLFVHAELPGPIESAAREQAIHVPDPRAYAGYLASRPRAAENDAVATIVRLVGEHAGMRAHIVHVSSADALESIMRAHDAGLAVSAETCPHYLTFASEEIPDGATAYKCAPPIRERENRERLWDALRQRVIAQVVTDHSPSTPALKCIGSGDFSKAWGGIASLQLGLPAVWTEARARGRSIADVSAWMSAATARLIGLDDRKGAVAAGYDADFVVWDPDAEFRVDPASIEHRHKITPYAQRVLNGRVQATYLRGQKIYESGQPMPGPTGRWLRGVSR